jgi:HSP20 family protein
MRRWVMKSLTPWFRTSGGSLEAFRNEMDEWTRRFFGAPLIEGASGNAWTPSVDVSENEKEVVVKADLPGVDPKDVDVSVRDGALILRGHKKEEREEKGKTFRRIERFEGEFYRELPLPAEADAEKISATSSKGVVVITVPKKPATVAKKVTVKAAD